MVRSLTLRSTLIIACVVIGSWNGRLSAAADDGGSCAVACPSAHVLDLTRVSFDQTPMPARIDNSPSRFTSSSSAVFAQRGWGRWHGGNGGARAAVILGTAAAIAGAAILVYANRPDCRSNPSAGGCGYGTKVIGGSMIAGGAVGIVVGAISWR